MSAGLVHVRLSRNGGEDVRWLAVDEDGNMRRLATREEDAVAMPRAGAEQFMLKLSASMAGREWAAEMVPQVLAAI